MNSGSTRRPLLGLLALAVALGCHPASEGSSAPLLEGDGLLAEDGLLGGDEILDGGTAPTDTFDDHPDFHTFETDQVRPLALSPDGRTLYAVNTPDNQLEVFRVGPYGVDHAMSVPVGLEPVAVAARTADEVWVVNQLSDSVSVVQFAQGRGTVVRTLLVGDEPRDIVFAGPGNGRAFITAAHRGQNVPFDPQLTTPGVGRADVWVFDADDLGTSLEGTPIAIVNLFTDKPRSLAVSPDGSRVYAAGYFTGNQTTVVAQGMVPPALYPPPLTNHAGEPAPVSALIVRWDGEHWVDERGVPHDYGVRIDLPDEDVFVIDANAEVPAQVAGEAGAYAHVGTVLFNMVANPVTGRVYVTNTEARNEQRFEGPGVFAGHTLRGHFSESRITVLDPGGSVSPIHLNPHIDYDRCCAPTPNDESERSLALPTQMAISPDGATLYVAALGSDKIGVFDTAELEAGTFTPSAASHVELTGGGPTGVVLGGDRLYVMTRFDNGISVIDTAERREIDHQRLFNPEPASVVAGRRFMYDARNGSSHGDSSCASCHIFGDFDGLAWDLGNPDGDTVENPNPFIGPTTVPRTFHPMKGPMVTQSLRGMDNMGPMHWRGDRTGAYEEPSAQPGGGAFDEAAGFMAFNPAFESLLGRDEQLPEEDMRAFADFVLQLVYPPNPIRNLDNSLTPAQQRGMDVFRSVTVIDTFDSGERTCIDCHVLAPEANLGQTRFPGFFGTDGTSSDVLQPQLFKTPHLRNAYQKIGMFGSINNPVFFLPSVDEHMGDQIRGFGFVHNGESPSLFHFVTATLFVHAPLVNDHGFPAGEEGDAMRRDVEQLMLAFDSNLAPIVGQQITLTDNDSGVAGARVDLLEQRASAGDCDLIAHDRRHGYLFHDGAYQPDAASSPALSSDELRATASSGPITFTCAPPGEGARRALDRDRDGVFNADERDHGTDPADPASY